MTAPPTEYDQLAEPQKHHTEYGSAETTLQTSIVSGESSVPPALFYACSAIACINGCNLGYDVGASGGAAVLMSDELHWTEHQTQAYVGCINMVAAFGGLLSGPLEDGLGRRRTLQISSLLAVSGLAIVCLSNDFLHVMVGRVLLGLSIGIDFNVGPTYVSEIAPSEMRGACVSGIEISLNFGILFAFVVNYFLIGALPQSISWRYMVGAAIPMPTITFILATCVMVESPRWLIMQGQTEEAKNIIAQISPEGTNTSCVADKIEKQVQEERETEQGWMQILCPTRAVRLMLLAGVGVNIVQQINGSESLVYYSQTILHKAGLDSREQQFGATILIGMAKAGFCLLAVLVTDNFGRRPLLLWSTTGMAACLLGIAIAIVMKHIQAQICSMMVFMAFFSLGVGPICWVVASEVFSTPIRGKALALSVFCNRLVSGIVSSTTLTGARILGLSGLFMFYCCMTYMSVVYVYYFIPETKGKTLEEVTDMFESEAARTDSDSVNNDVAA